MGSENTTLVTIVTPVYNDWSSFEMLVQAIDDAFASVRSYQVEVLAIDDGSSDVAPTTLPRPLVSVRSVSILRLVRNLGHQGAIAVGLSCVEARGGHAFVGVLDADGEDKPADLLKLLSAIKSDLHQQCVFAQRRKRSESLVFRVCHRLFLLMERLLVGRSDRVGNFSVLSPAAVSAIVRSPEAWLHHAGAVKRLRLPFGTVPCDRGRRFCGSSKMKFTSLILHGLRGISVFREFVAIRLFLMFLVLFAAVLVVVPAVLVLKFFTTTSTPGWTTAVIGTVSILLMQVFAMLIQFVFVVLGSSRDMCNTPLNVHASLIAEVRTLWGTADAVQIENRDGEKHG